MRTPIGHQVFMSPGPRRHGGSVRVCDVWRVGEREHGLTHVCWALGLAHTRAGQVLLALGRWDLPLEPEEDGSGPAPGLPSTSSAPVPSFPSGSYGPLERRWCSLLCAGSEGLSTLPKATQQRGATSLVGSPLALFGRQAMPGP